MDRTEITTLIKCELSYSIKLLVVFDMHTIILK